MEEAFEDCIGTIISITEPQHLEVSLAPQDFDFISLIDTTTTTFPTMGHVGPNWEKGCFDDYDEAEDDEEEDDNTQLKSSDLVPDLFSSIKRAPKFPQALDVSKDVKIKVAELEEVAQKAQEVKDEDKPGLIADMIMNSVRLIMNDMEKVKKESIKWSWKPFSKNPKTRLENFLKNSSKKFNNTIDVISKQEGKSGIFSFLLVFRLFVHQFITNEFNDLGATFLKLFKNIKLPELNEDGVNFTAKLFGIMLDKKDESFIAYILGSLKTRFYYFRNTPISNKSSLIENYIYSGLGINFYDKLFSNASRNERDYFGNYFRTTNAALKMLKTSEMMTILKTIVRSNQNTIPPELFIPIVKMEDDPTFYFNTYMLFKKMFFSDNEEFDRKVADCYDYSLRRSANVQSKWLIILAILNKPSNNFRNALMSAQKDFLRSQITYDELYKEVTNCTTETLGIESSWEPNVTKEKEDFLNTFKTSIKSLFFEVPPGSLVKLPNDAFPKDKDTEEFFLSGFENYFNDHKTKLNYETFWKLLSRFLGNNLKISSVDETHKLLEPIKLWLKHNGLKSEFMEFVRCSLVYKSYASRFFFDDNIDKAKFFDFYLCDIKNLSSNYGNYKKLEEEEEGKREATQLYSLIMSEIGRNVGEKYLSDEDSLKGNVELLRKSMGTNTYFPRVYVKLFQVAADTFLDVVNKAELIVKDCNIPEILSLEGHAPREFEGLITKKYTKAINSARTKMQEEISALADERLTDGTASYLVEKGNALKEYYGKWKVDFPAERFGEIREAFTEQLKRATVIKDSVLYLSNLGYKVPELHYSESAVLLVDLKRECAEILGTFTQNGMNLDDFAYFVVSKSDMFQFKFEEKTHSLLKTGAGDIEQFKSVFAETCAFFRELLVFENVHFNIFTEIKDITEKFGDNFDAELDKIAKSDIIKMTSNVDVKRALNIIREGRELISLNKSCSDMYNFLTAEGICSEEDLDRFKAKLQEFNNDTLLVDSGRIIREYKEMYIDSLSEMQMRTFQCVQEYIDVVNFIKELSGEFDKKTELASNLHTDRFESTLITNLVNTRNFIAFMIEYEKGATVKEFCMEAVRKIPSTKSDLDRNLEYIKSVNSNLSKLRSWYATSSLSIDNLKPFTEEVLRYGSFAGDMSHSGSGMYLEVEKDGTLSRHNQYFIRNMIGGLNVFLAKKKSKKDKNSDNGGGGGAADDNDNAEEEEEEEDDDTKIVKGFVTITDMAEQYYKICVDLKGLGHPEYQEKSIEITERRCVKPTKHGKENDLEILGIIDSVRESIQERTEEVTKTLEDWKQLVGDMSSGERGERRLLFLNPKQLLALWKVFTELHGAANEDRYVKHYLMPYLIQCFPDNVDKLYKNIWHIKKELMARAPSRDKKFSPKEMIDFIKDFIQWVRVKLVIVDDFDPEEKKVETKDGLFIHLLSPQRTGDPEDRPSSSKCVSRDAVYGRIARILGGRIHPSLLFECRRDTTKENVEWFLRRVSKFPDLVFVITNVNYLDIKAKEVLLDSTKKLVDDGFMLGTLHLVFTEDTGYELFDFIKSRKIDEDYEDDLPATAADAPGTPNLCSLKIYDGKPLSGKSYAIRHDINALLVYHINRQTAISVVEDFMPGVAAKKIEDALFADEGIYPTVALRINLSPYAPVEEFGVFLYNFFAWGLIADETTGRVIHVGTELEWNVFIEIGTPPEGDDECNYDSVAGIRSALPLLSAFKPVFVDTTDTPYEFSEDVKVCVAVNKAIESSNGYWSFANTGNPIVTFVREGHPDFIKFASENLKPLGPLSIQGRMVKILSRRSMSLYEYARKADKNKGMIPPGRKYPTYLALVRVALDEELSQYKTYPLKNITKYIYFPENEEPVLMDFSENSVSRKAMENEMVGNETMSSWRIVSLREVCNNTDMLYDVIGGAFEVNPAVCKKLLEAREYVLTPDFGMKLMFLNTCGKAKQNVVFSGDTGTGKSELLETFSQLVNLASDQLPRPVEELGKFLAEKIAGCDVQGSSGELIKFVEERCDSDDVRLFNEIRALLAEFVSASTKKYKLLSPSEYMLAAKKALEEGNLAEALPAKEDVVQLVRDILRGDTKELFHKLQMHQHITSDMFREKVREVKSSAETAGEDITVIGFIDECTSTTVMGIVKEVLIDNTLDGDPLPNNIMWIGAFNRNDVDKAKEAKIADFTGLSEDTDDFDDMEDEEEEEEGDDKIKIVPRKNAVAAMDEPPDFAVRPPPKSLEILEICFEPMTVDQQKYFLRNLLRLKAHNANDAEARDVEQAVSFSHEFLREKRIKRIHPSIRDFVRCVNLYVYFSEHSLRGEKSKYDTDYFPKQPSGARTDARTYRHRYSLALAIAVAYYFRLNPALREEFTQRYIEEGHVLPELDFAEEEKKMLSKSKKSGDPIFLAFRAAGMKLYKNTMFLDGIAPTDSFLENLFCTVVCIDAKIPLMIFGPPGCSKTLSFTIAMKNMKGQHSTSAFYRSLSYVSPLRYQCSRESTDTEIQVVYENAERRQDGFDKAAADGRTAGVEHQRVVVLLDEGGLPDETKAPLKILHYVLDHPKVSTVILTNKILDAAKTNRTALLQQTAPAESDLYQLVKTCVYGHSDGAIPEKKAQVIRALAAGYRKLMKLQRGSNNGVTSTRNFYHLRDFVYFLRYLGRCERKNESSIGDINTIVRALRRNFGGVNEECFVNVVRVFVGELQQQIPTYDRSGLNRALESFSVIDALRESLAETIERPEDPNTAPYRYVLVIDPSDTEVGTSLLFDSGICDRAKTEIVHVASFGHTLGGDDDDDDSARSAEEKNRRDRDKEDAIVRMKSAMEDEEGRTVMLVNPLEISGSFYDVFNRHFEVLSEEDKDKKKTCYRYFANIAVGSLSQPCIVSPLFRVIVHLPHSALRRTPAPFLNRFEKYYLSLDTFFAAAGKGKGKDTESARIHAGVTHAVDYFGGKDLFYGLVPKETVTSLLINSEHNGTLDIPPVFHTHGNEEKKSWPGENEGMNNKDLAKVRTVNYHLLQLARPEWLLSRPDVPIWYLEEYISLQEHFSIRRLVEAIFGSVFKVEKDNAKKENDDDDNDDIDNDSDNDNDDSDEDNDDDDTNKDKPKKIEFGKFSKWCIFTRSCGELARLHADKELQNKLFRCDDKPEAFSEWGYVMSLERISSNKECMDGIDSFIDSKKDVFVCVADMTKVTADQINLVRSRIDSDFLAAQKVSIVIQHFPPEIQHIQDVQSNQVMYLNNWNYTYVDALGLDEGDKLDTRFWLKYAFDLKESDRARMEKMFTEKTNRELDTLCKSSKVIPPKKSVLPLSFDTYKLFKKNFPKFFKGKFLTGKSGIADKYFKKVIDMWCSLVKDIIRRDCALIQRGEMSMGLLAHIGSSFEKIIRPVTKRISEVLCSNFSLEAVMYALNNNIANEIDFINAVIDKLHVFSIDELYTTTVGSRVLDNKIALEATYRTPSYLPLFDFVFKRIKELLKIAKKTAKEPNEYQSVAETLSKLVDKDPLAEVFEIVSEDEELMALYMRDVVVWGIGLPNFYVPRNKSPPEAFVLLDKIAARVKDLTKGYNNNFAYIHAVPEFYQKELLNYATALKPLLQLSPLPPLDGILDPKDTHINTTLDIVKILHNFLLENVSSDGLIAFGKVFRDIKAFAPYKRKLCYDVKGKAFTTLDTEYIVYLFLFNTNPDDITDAYAAQVIELFEKAQKNKDSIKNGLEFACSLRDSLQNKESLNSAAFFTSVAMYYIEYSTGENELPPAYIEEDLKLFLNTTNIPELSTMWKHQFLGRWLENKAVAWHRIVIDILNANDEVKALQSVDLLSPTQESLGNAPFILYHVLTDYCKKRIDKEKEEKKFGVLLGLSEDNAVEAAVKTAMLAKLLYNVIVAPSKNDEEASKKLLEKDKDGENKFGVNKTDVNEFGKRLFSDDRLKNAQLFFFYLFRDESKIQNVCRWSTFLSENGLNDYNITVSSDCADMFQPLYVINPQNPLHKYYTDVRNAVGTSAQRIVEYTKTTLGGISANEKISRIGIIRMMLISVTYYEYFVKNKPCDAVKTAVKGELKGLLNIDNNELPAFLFFTFGHLTAQNTAEYFSFLRPQQADNITNLDPLYSIFSVNGRKENDDFMANLLALTLGCHKKSTHMYERTFDLKALNGTKGPGSAYNRNNWDCGYKTNDDGSLQTPNDGIPIMHNNRQYRLVLNAMTWGAISWSQLLSASNYGIARSNNHFLNFVGDCDMTIRGISRTEEQKTRAYVFERASGFFTYFYNDEDYISKNINTVHFINETMFELWNVTNNNGNPDGRPSGLTSHYATSQEAINYENEFEKILNKVSGSYNARKAALLEELTKANDKLKRIFAMRAECSRILMDPFVRMNTFKDKIETLTDDKNAKFIREFLGDPTKYDIMKKLHVIVAFYLELHRLFDYRLTEDEVNALTIGDVVKGTAKYSSGLLQTLWPSFKDVWRQVVDFVKPKECVNAGEFEGALALIDDVNSPFVGSLLTFGDGEDGEIYRSISDGISKLQDDILNMRNEDLNPNSLGYDDNEKGDLPLESLTENDASRLITGENYRGELDLIIFTHMHIDAGLRRESVTYDYEGIARDIMCRYTSGRLHLRSSGTMTIRRVCNFTYGDLEPVNADESEEQRVARRRRALVDSFRPLHGIESLRVYMEKADPKKLAAFDVSNAKYRSKIEEIATSTKASSEVIEMKYVMIADVLAAVLRHVISNANDPKKTGAAAKKTIGYLYKNEVCGEDLPKDLSFMDEWPATCLLSASSYLLETVSAKRYLFNDVKLGYSRKIESKKEKEKLDAYRRSLIWSKDDPEDVVAKKKAAAPAKIRLLECLFQALNSNRPLLKETSFSLKRAFDPAITGMFQSDKEEEVEILKAIKTVFFAGFMAWLQKLISDMHWEMSKDAGKTAEYEAGSASAKDIREAQVQEVYKEFIPPKPTILKYGIERMEVPYNEKLVDYIVKLGLKPEEVVVVNSTTKEEVTEEERKADPNKYKVLLIIKKKKEN